MGSQQLLLIVLGVIIVGVAVAAGIAIFGGNADQANRDAISQDVLRMASTAQGYYRKPKLLGGGGQSFTGITLAALGLEDDGSGKYENENAQYFLVGIGTTLYIVATSNIVPSSYIVLRVLPDDVKFYIIGWGRKDTDPT